MCLEAFLEKLSEKRQKASAIYDQTIVNLMRRRKLESSSKSEQRCYYGFVTFLAKSLMGNQSLIPKFNQVSFHFPNKSRKAD